MNKKDLEVLKAARAIGDYCESIGMRRTSCTMQFDYKGNSGIPEKREFPELEEPQEPEILQEPEVLRKLKEIKTIARNIDYMSEFDERVNRALAAGWALVKREVLIPQTPGKNIALYAELVRYEDD